MLVPEKQERDDRVLGQRIGILRRERGITQAELARRLGVSPSAMGMYEQGRRQPSGEILVALSEEFGVSTDFLLTGKMRTAADEQTCSGALRSMLASMDQRLESRPDRPFSRQELAVLLAALLTEA